MSPPTHHTAGGPHLELQRRARTERRSTNEMLVWYVHEQFLYRVSISPHRQRLILKGGMLLVAFDARRATQDIDMLARGIANDHTTVAGVVAEIARIDVPDGVDYAIDQVATTTIRDDASYSGVRVTCPPESIGPRSHFGSTSASGTR